MLRTPSPPIEPRLTRWAAAFASLRYRDFRFLLLSSASLGFGQWFQQIGMGWLTYVVTNSPVQIGIVAAIRGVVLVAVSVPAGMLADRFDRRSLVLWSTAGAVVQASILAALVLLGFVQWWHLWLFALVEGVFAAFNQPARSALVYDQVGPKTLENAVALTAVTNNLARVTGPTIAGMVIAWSGVGACFLVLTALKGVAFLLTIPMRAAPPVGASKQGTQGWGSYLEGLVVVGRSRVLLGLLLVQAIPVLVVYPYLAFVPIYTSDVLGFGKNATAYGFLMSAVGFGSLVGAGLLTLQGSGRRGGTIMLVGAFFYLLMVMLFSLSTQLYIAFGCLALAGLSNVMKLTINQTLYLLHTPGEVRGRVLAVNGMVGMGLQPIGNMVMGPAIGAWGFATTVASFAGAACLMLITLSVVIPELWKLSASTAKPPDAA